MQLFDIKFIVPYSVIFGTVSFPIMIMAHSDDSAASNTRLTINHDNWPHYKRRTAFRFRVIDPSLGSHDFRFRQLHQLVRRVGHASIRCGVQAPPSRSECQEGKPSPTQRTLSTTFGKLKVKCRFCSCFFSLFLMY